MDGMKNSFGSLVKRELVRLTIYIRIRSGFMYCVWRNCANFTEMRTGRANFVALYKRMLSRPRNVPSDTIDSMHDETINSEY